MTWTSIHPELGKYRGCLTPAEVAEKMFSKNTPWQRFCNVNYVVTMPDRDDDPWNISVDSKEWMIFWGPVYNLRDKPRSEWTDTEALSYFSMDLLIHFAAARP